MRWMYPLFDEEARQFALYCFADGVALSRREAVQDQLFDVQLNVLCCSLALIHTQPPISASVKDFSSLAYSLRADRNRYFICTGSPASAARKAALSAILRIFPPVTLSRASFITSSPSVGALVGKMRCQISTRCNMSGNGNWTMKRMRRIKAVSNAFFILVVRMARPR